MSSLYKFHEKIYITKGLSSEKMFRFSNIDVEIKGGNETVTKKIILDKKEMREIIMALKVKQNMLQMKIHLTCREMHQMRHF